MPLVLPRPDGTGWPDVPARAGFDVQTTGVTGERRAAEPDALGVAERVLEALLPHLRVEAAREDLPHVEKLLLVAARRGAGLGLLEREGTGEPGVVDRAVAGALWQARAQVGAPDPAVDAAASYLLLAAYWAARTDEPPHLEAVRRLVEALP